MEQHPCPEPGNQALVTTVLFHSDHGGDEQTQWQKANPHITLILIDPEDGKPRNEMFAKTLFRKHLFDFTHNPGVPQDTEADAQFEQLAEGACRIYTTDDYESRGEFGEFILHAFLLDYYKTAPIVCKIAFKTGNNDTVKGFDAVHIQPVGTEVELWLGESKFYTDSNKAIYDAVQSIEKHLESSYMRDEFTIILSQVSPNHNFHRRIKSAMSQVRSLDEIRKNIIVPILITYTSNALAQIDYAPQQRMSELTEEANKIAAKFDRKIKPSTREYRTHLILFPVQDKAQLAKTLNNTLATWRDI